MLHRAKITVSPELLLRALCLPADARVRGAQYDSLADKVELLLDHPDLRGIEPESATVPLASPRIGQVDGKPQFQGWGQ